MNNLKIIFFGSPYYSIPLLEKIIELGHEVILVISQSTNRTRRGKIIKTAVHEYCEDKKIDFLLPTNFDNFFYDKIQKINFDVGVVYAYGKIIPENVISLSKFGIMNLHCSLLPKYRGAAPIQHSLINGDEYTGFTYFEIDQKLDEGKLLLREKYKILESDTCFSIQNKLTKLAVKKLSLAIGKITSKDYLETDEHCEISYAHKILKEDAKINWNMDVEKIYNTIRALHIWPVAHTNLFGKKIKILESKSIRADHNNDIGTIKEFSKDNLFVNANGGYLSIIKLQLEGKKPMTNKDLYNSNLKFKEILLSELINN